MKCNTASETEVLDFYTQALRMEDERFKIADAFKAAEFFVKYYSLLEHNSEENGGVVIIDDIVRQGGEKDG